MRITNNVLVNNLKRNIWTNLKNMEELQMQMATGKSINKPSDNPTGLVTSLRLTTRIKEGKQYQDNVDNAISWLEGTEDALDGLSSIVNRIKELCVYGANGTLSNEDRQKIGDELQQLIEESATIANTAYGDRYVFGGTNTTQRPYEDGVWNANEAIINYEIGVGITIPVNITAQEVFRYDDPSKDLFGTLNNILDHLINGNAEELGGNDLERLQGNIEQLLSCRSKIGAKVNRLELAKSRLEDQELKFTTLLSETEDIDPAEVIMNMKNQEYVYQSALAVGAKVIMPTLMDFLN